MGALRHGRPDTVAATSPQFFTAVAAWLVSVVLRRPFLFEISDLWPASIVAVGAMRPGLVLTLLERLELFLYGRRRTSWPRRRRSATTWWARD